MSCCLRAEFSICLALNLPSSAELKIIWVWVLAWMSWIKIKFYVSHSFCSYTHKKLQPAFWLVVPGSCRVTRACDDVLVLWWQPRNAVCSIRSAGEFRVLSFCLYLWTGQELFPAGSKYGYFYDTPLVSGFLLQLLSYLFSSILFKLRETGEPSCCLRNH